MAPITPMKTILGLSILLAALLNSDSAFAIHQSITGEIISTPRHSMSISKDWLQFKGSTIVVYDLELFNKYFPQKSCEIGLFSLFARALGRSGTEVKGDFRLAFEPKNLATLTIDAVPFTSLNGQEVVLYSGYYKNYQYHSAVLQTHQSNPETAPRVGIELFGFPSPELAAQLRVMADGKLIFAVDSVLELRR